MTGISGTNDALTHQIVALMSRDTAGYEGVTVAGLAVVRYLPEPSLFLAQRAYDETDDEAVRETWEFPGGHLNPEEGPLAAAVREFGEEIGFPLPEGEVINGWRSKDGHYQGFTYEPVGFPSLTDWEPTSEVQAVGWFTREEIRTLAREKKLRPEVARTPWDIVYPAVSGNKEQDMDEAAQYAAIPVMPIPIHGVVAPEEVEAGDGRGFAAGAVTRRPLRLPFRDITYDVGAHQGAFTVGSVDRLMRADNLIHWEGLLMPAAATESIVEKMVFFGGRYGVSVDGDQGSIDARTARNEKGQIAGPLWFDQVRASGLTGCDIPAFHEAHVAFGHHPTMPDEDAVVTAALYDSGDMIGGRQEVAPAVYSVLAPAQYTGTHAHSIASTSSSPHTFDRGPGWVTDPVATNRIHDYWTKKGEEGYAKVGWGTPGDFTRARALIGAKIAQHSPDKMRFLNQIIAQWHFDALGYWPGDLGKPGNPPDTAENRKRAAVHAADKGLLIEEVEGVDESDIVWETVITSSAGTVVRPSIDYFTRHPNTGATAVEEVDANGLRRTYGYVAEWGVCHIGIDGRCVEPPRPANADFPEFHLGRTKLDDGTYINTGVLTYLVEHRGAEQILTETAEQQHFDNVANAWAAVRLGIDDRGIWYSGYVLPGIPDEDVVLIEATGQVSGEWKYGSLRACQSVNTSGFPVLRSSAVFDDDGNVISLVAVTTGKDMALVASANGVATSECYENSPKARMEALRKIDEEVRAITRMGALRTSVDWADLAGKIGN